MKRWGVAAVAGVAAVVALAGCSRPATPPAGATTPTAEVTGWAPATYTEIGNVAYRWTTGVTCKAYQDGCFGVTIVAKDGCPNGVYVELAVYDSSGAVVDKANDITAAITPNDIAHAVLSPPGGTPDGAKARVSKLNCL